MKKWIISLFLECLCHPLLSQSDVVLDIAKFGLRQAYEKVYLHLDKPHYEPGDTLWFKAYAMLAPEMLPDTISVPLVVDLFSTTGGELLHRQHIELQNGIGYGTVPLPDSLAHPYWTIRAYTNLMRNYGEDHFFTKDIPIYDPAYYTTIDLSIPNLIDIQFFPEGGQLIEGMENRLAFRAKHGDGRGIGLSGMLLDSEGDTLTVFQDQHLGMGSLLMTPEKGKEYHAWVSLDGLEPKKVALPKAKASGIAMRVDNLTSAHQIKVYLQGQGLPWDRAQQWKLMATMNERLEMQVPFELKKAGNLISIDKSSFPSGVLKLSLVDEEYKIMAERHVFIDNRKKTELLFSTPKPVYTPRDTVKLDICLIDEDGYGIKGNFSVSATDARQVEHQQEEETLTSYFLLSSELKEPIQKANSYFDPSNRQAPLLLDLVMLTHEWKRYQWEKLLEKEWPINEHLREKGLVLAGKVTKLNDNPVDKVHFVKVLINPRDGESPSFFEAETDEEGNFVLFDLHYTDSVDINMESYSERKRKRRPAKEVKNTKVSLLPLPYPDFKPRKPDYYGLQARDTTKAESDYLSKIAEVKDFLQQYLLSNDVLLDEVAISARSLKPNEFDTRTMQYGGRPTSYMEVNEEFFGYANIFHLIRGRFAGVTVHGNVFSPEPMPFITMRSVGTLNNDGTVQILIDGNPVDAATAFFFPVVDIERIDILRGLAANAVFGAAGGGGTVNILTRQGNPNYDITKDSGIQGNGQVFSSIGFTSPSQFRVPALDPERPMALQRDIRSTLYWSAHEKSDQNGDFSLRFPLSDERTEVMVSLEGITDDGQPIFGQYKLKVR